MHLAEAKNLRPEPEDQFDRYLFERFAELKRELEEQIAKQGPSRGVLREFSRKARRPARGGWLAGVAALFLVTVSLPLVVQLNRKQAEQRASLVSGSAGEKSGTQEAYSEVSEAEATRRSAKESDRAAAKAKKNAVGPVTPAPAERVTATKEEAPAALKPAPAPAPAPVGTRAPAPVEQDKTAAQGDVPESGAPAEMQMKSRSAPAADAQFRLKQSELATIEKAEMEKLWNEYEKNPQEFVKDKIKTHRLKLLLSRYDTRGRKVNTK